MLNPTEEQLKDPKWWDENQPYHYPILIKDLNRNVYEWHAEINDRYVDQNCRFWLKSSSHHEVIARPVCQPEHTWRGPEDGLPPIGTVCEALWNEGSGVWFKTTVFGVNEHNQPIHRWEEGPKKFEYQASPFASLFDGRSYFRPIRTPEQIAADDWQKEFGEMLKIYAGEASDHIGRVRAFYNHGYRKLTRERLVELTKDETMADAILAGYNVERGI